jgi:hypothetical protein
MMQKRKGERQAIGIGALEACAADHGIDLVAHDIGPDTVPEELNRALVAVGGKHAGAAEFKKFERTVFLQKLADIEFAFRVETAPGFRNALAQEPIGADHP